MKRIIVSLLVAVVLITAVGCGKKTDSNSEAADIVLDDSTLGNKLAGMFLTDISEGDVQALAEKIASATELDCVVIEANEGYLNGFSEEITGFTSGVQISPMIGSIPFVAYILKTDDTEGLKSTLEKAADPRWNICTEAAETVCVTSGEYVFFTMCPGEDE